MTDKTTESLKSLYDHLESNMLPRDQEMDEYIQEISWDLYLEVPGTPVDEFFQSLELTEEEKEGIEKARQWVVDNYPEVKE